MKKGLTWVIFCCLLACHANKGSDKKRSVIQTDKDSTVKASFIYHFHILDFIACANINDTVYVAATPSIQFMEVNTRIEAHSEGTLIGKIKFSKGDLKKWHGWFERNSNK